MKIFVFVGLLNGLILLIVFGMLFIVVYKKKIIGDYKYLFWLIVLGVLVVIVMVIMGVYMLFI